MLNRIKYADGSVQGIEEIPYALREKYKEVFEIDARWLIEAAARRAKWIDQSQSLNIFYNGTSGRELSEAYFTAWRMGLKTTYYLRTLGASQVEKASVSSSEHGSTHSRMQWRQLKLWWLKHLSQLLQVCLLDLVRTNGRPRWHVLLQERKRECARVVSRS
jgi:ribonucleotide reductase alpha subunit